MTHLGIAGVLALVAFLYAYPAGIIALILMAPNPTPLWGKIVLAVLWPIPVAVLLQLGVRAMEVALLVYSLPATIFGWPEYTVSLTFTRK